MVSPHRAPAVSGCLGRTAPRQARRHLRQAARAGRGCVAAAVVVRAWAGPRPPARSSRPPPPPPPGCLSRRPSTRGRNRTPCAAAVAMPSEPSAPPPSAPRQGGPLAAPSAAPVELWSVLARPAHGSTHDDDARRKLPPDADAGSPSDGDGSVCAAEAWNEPRRNAYRLAAAFWCFLVMGANDAAYGVGVCSRARPGRC